VLENSEKHQHLGVVAVNVRASVQVGASDSREFEDQRRRKRDTCSES
jgi:hypothetical protein